MIPPIAGPVRPDDRIPLLDTLRGFALLGILVVNWEWTTTDLQYGIVVFLAEASFYPIFSLLFGLGFAMQLARAEQAGRRFVARYAWRSFVLFLIGLAHVALMWRGDILADYAIASVLLLLVRRWPARLLLALAAALMVVHMMPRSVVPPPGEFWIRADPERRQAAQMQQAAAIAFNEAHPPALCRYLPATAAYRAFVCGNITNARQQVASFFTLTWWKNEADILAMFVLGLYVGRRRLLTRVDAHRRALSIICVLALLAGVAGNAMDVAAVQLPGVLSDWFIVVPLGGVGLALFYLTGLTLLWTYQPRAQRALSVLRYAGRMALTNYLMQSFIFVIVIGRLLDASGAITGWWSFGFMGGVYIVQMLYSRWWLRHFEYGPVEYVWRWLTWWRRPRRLLPRALPGSTATV